jgi:transposase
MYLRRIRKKSRGEEYEHWALVESVRTERGPRQRIVASIGKLPGLDEEEQIGWESLRRELDGRELLKGTLFENSPVVPKWATVNTRKISVERIRRFGDVYIGLLLWKKLELDKIFTKIQSKGREKIDWPTMYCISTLARFCQPSSDLAISENWYEKSALEDLVGIKVEQVNESRLYRTLDRILPQKDKVCRHLQERYRDLFGTDFEFLIYDVTSTYFEGQALANEQAKRGYSRDKRPDCMQVCIGLVVTIEGLPVGYEVFDGNRRDVTTLEDMVELMEEKYGQANRVWVFDRGIVSEENIEYLNRRGARYIVGTPKSMLKKFDAELSEKEWDEVESGVEVRLAKHPDYPQEKVILCRSARRKEKEKAMLKRQKERLEGEIIKVQRAIRENRLTNPEKAGTRIGRWSGRYSRAENLFDIKYIKDEKGELIDLEYRYKPDRLEWADKTQGNYLLRTNITEDDPRKLWKIYMQLNQAENAFRTSKSDLGLRPIYHQKEHRVQAHIFICFLALSMWRCLEMWMETSGLGKSPNKLLEELREIRTVDVLLPVKDRGNLRLRVVVKPEKHAQILLDKMGIKLPNQSKVIENVVKKTMS